MNLLVVAQVTGLNGISPVTYWYKTDKNIIAYQGTAYTSRFDKKDYTVIITIDNDLRTM